MENKRARPSLGDIRTIVGGNITFGSTRKARNTYLKMVQNIQLTSLVPKMAHIDNLIIGFIEDDA